MKRRMKIGAVVVLGVAMVACIAAIAFKTHDANKSEELYNDLTDLIVEQLPKEPEEEAEEAEPEEDPAIKNAVEAQKRYGAIFERNNDFMAWITIDGTNVSYPVMQTPNEPNYYLKRAFDKSYSEYGVPYIDERCMVGISNNIVVYGHNMSDGALFHDLLHYDDKAFYEDHQIIQFDTLAGLAQYQVVAAFKFNTNKETFMFNQYATMNEEEFEDYMDNVHSRQLYDTGVDAEYGDELLTLSTCEYTYRNGRFIVVAKKVS